MERGEPAKVALEIEVVFSQSVLNNVLMLLYEIFYKCKNFNPESADWLFCYIFHIK